MNSGIRIRELVEAKLAGHRIDAVGFVDQLFVLAAQVGEVKCALAREGCLRFQVPDEASCDVEVDAAKGKLRMMCARLGVLCNEQSGREVSPYGGEAAFAYELPPGTPLTWNVRFKNAPAEQEFLIAAQ